MTASTAVLPRPRPSSDDLLRPTARERAANRATDRPAASERVLHQLVRRELRLLAELAPWAPADDAPRTRALTRHAELISRVLLHHHAVERDRLWPALQRALPGDRELAEHLAAWRERCAGIDHALRDVATAARQWAVVGNIRARDAFALACRDLANAVDAQTAEEERTLLPLLAALDPAEWAAIASSACAGLRWRERLFVLGLALEDSCAGDRARLLCGLPRPTRTAWRVYGSGRYRATVVRLRGEPPAA
jgi:Hemerythrin HHE cation binding domain